MGLVQTATGSVNNSGTLSVSFGSNIGAGHGVIICLEGYIVDYPPDYPLTISPASGGDSYSLAVQDSVDYQSAIFYILSSAGGYKQINFAQTGGEGLAAWMYEVATLTALDQTSSNEAATGGSWTSGTTSTTAQGAEFWAGVGVATTSSSGTASGPSSPWTNEGAQAPE